jgi:hypothetical protein
VNGYRGWPLPTLIGAILIIAIVLMRCTAPAVSPAPPTLTPAPVITVLPTASPAPVTPTATPTVAREPLVEVTATTRTPATNTATPPPTVAPTETPRPATPTAGVQRG